MPKKLPEAPSTKLIVIILTGVLVAVSAFMYAIPIYSVWAQEMAGKAALAEALFSKKIAIEEAKARKESAKYESEAEIVRARGVAEANRIIGNSLQNSESYLRYLWIQSLNMGNSETIYVPTEAGLPILEAGRRPNHRRR